MTTILSVPYVVYRDGQVVDSGTREVTLDGAAEELYLAGVGVRQSYLTLRQWADDAAQVNTDWPTMTQGQKDNATRETIRRLGVFLDRFADLLLLENR